MISGRPTDRAYVRAVERALTRWNGRSVVLSPRDFALLSRWQAAGVPLGTVLEAIQAVGRRAGSRRAVTLAYASAAVNEAWEVIRAGRAPSVGSRSPGTISFEEARQKWVAASLAPEAGPGLKEVLVGLIRRVDAGEEPNRVDLDLDRDLPGTVSGTLLAEAEGNAHATIARVLRPGRETTEAAVRRAVVDRLRQRLDLPRLAHCADDRGRVGPDGEATEARMPGTD